MPSLTGLGDGATLPYRAWEKLILIKIAVALTILMFGGFEVGLAAESPAKAEGPAPRVFGKASFSGYQIVTSSELARAVDFPTGQPFYAKTFDAILKKIQELYGDRGYMAARIKPVFTTDASGTADVRFDISEGALYRVSQIYMENPDLIDFSKKIDLKPGDVYSASVVLRGIARIKKNRYVENVNLNIQPEPDNRIALGLEVDYKEKKYQIQISTGPDTPLGLASQFVDALSIVRRSESRIGGDPAKEVSDIARTNDLKRLAAMQERVLASIDDLMEADGLTLRFTQSPDKPRALAAHLLHDSYSALAKQRGEFVMLIEDALDTGLSGDKTRSRLLDAASQFDDAFSSGTVYGFPFAAGSVGVALLEPKPSTRLALTVKERAVTLAKITGLWKTDILQSKSNDRAPNSETGVRIIHNILAAKDIRSKD